MSSSARASSPDGTVKKTDTMGTVEEPNTLKGYGSVPGVMDEVTRVVDHKAERRLCRKFDYRLFNALDKGNLGNAETDGMSKGM